MKRGAPYNVGTGDILPKSSTKRRSTKDLGGETPTGSVLRRRSTVHRLPPGLSDDQRKDSPKRNSSGVVIDLYNFGPRLPGNGGNYPEEFSPLLGKQYSPKPALVTLDPATGAILAMVGGRDYQTSPLNRSVKAHRQPGSALKPFVFATALEQNFTAATILYDHALEIPLENGTVWTRRSATGNTGKITLREALRESVNTIAVQLVQTLGIPTVATQLEQMGIRVWSGKEKANDLGLRPAGPWRVNQGGHPT